MQFGTHGRKWYTDTKNNIAFSFFIKTNCEIEMLNGITIKIAEIFIEVFKELYNINLQIKTPNDIVYKNKKIGGILTESKIQSEVVKCIVVGVGINTNQMEFAEDIKFIASSIKKEFGINVENKKVIRKFCEIFDKWLSDRKII